jgi:hypothetical protein
MKFPIVFFCGKMEERRLYTKLKPDVGKIQAVFDFPHTCDGLGTVASFYAVHRRH